MVVYIYIYICMYMYMYMWTSDFIYQQFLFRWLRQNVRTYSATQTTCYHGIYAVYFYVNMLLFTIIVVI